MEASIKSLKLGTSVRPGTNPDDRVDHVSYRLIRGNWRGGGKERGGERGGEITRAIIQRGLASDFRHRLTYRSIGHTITKGKRKGEPA